MPRRYGSRAVVQTGATELIRPTHFGSRVGPPDVEKAASLAGCSAGDAWGKSPGTPCHSRAAIAVRAIEPASTKVSGVRFALGSISAILIARISARPPLTTASVGSALLMAPFNRTTDTANRPNKAR